VGTNRIQANSLTISEAFQKKEEEGRIIKKEKKGMKKNSDY
jgi:DNA-binding transcriptional regulator YhcF (GntR family)